MTAAAAGPVARSRATAVVIASSWPVRGSLGGVSVSGELLPSGVARRTHNLMCVFDAITHMAIWDRLVELAAEQHGYVTTRDARDIGVDPVQLRLLAARGRLERAGRGVYRVPVLPRGEHDDLAAAVSWTLGRGVISHESALMLHALADVNPSRIHLTVPRDNHPRAAGGELYRLHRRGLPASDITSVDAIPVTTVARTIKDYMKTGADPYQLRAAIERAEAEGVRRRGAAVELRAGLGQPSMDYAPGRSGNPCD